MDRVVWVSGLLILIFTVAGFVAGAMITHDQLRDVNRRRYEQGHQAGEKVGWDEAADEIWQRVLAMRRHYARSTQGADYLNGYEDAAKHLKKHWERLDRQP